MSRDVDGELMIRVDNDEHSQAVVMASGAGWHVAFFDSRGVAAAYDAPKSAGLEAVARLLLARPAGWPRPRRKLPRVTVIAGEGSLEHRLGVQLVRTGPGYNSRLEPSPNKFEGEGALHLHVELSDWLLARITSAPGRWKVIYCNRNKPIDGPGGYWVLQTMHIDDLTRDLQHVVADVLRNAPKSPSS